MIFVIALGILQIKIKIPRTKDNIILVFNKNKSWNLIEEELIIW